MKMQELLLVTGLSGAGKTLAMRALEDIGYFCVDNLPADMLPELLQKAKLEPERMGKLAVTVDVRGGHEFGVLPSMLEKRPHEGLRCRVIFLDSDNSVLVHRYKETRRNHPLTVNSGLSAEQAIIKERKLLEPLYALSDIIIDTGLLSAAALREHIAMQFTKSINESMSITVLSFGFKHGAPRDSDLMFDVRCLPNPYYIAELRGKTGLCSEVYDYVFSFESAQKLYEHIENMLIFALPLYIKEGKCHLSIAVGCTGGKHRSISFARRISDKLSSLGYTVTTLHRDAQNAKI